MIRTLTHNSDALSNRPSHRLLRLALTSLLIGLMASLGFAQAPLQYRAAAAGKAAEKAKGVDPVEIHGGIEIGSSGVKAVVVRIPLNAPADAEGYNLTRLMEGTINTSIMQRDEQKRFTTAAIEDTAKAVKNYYTQMKAAPHSLTDEHIHIVVSSGVNGTNPKDIDAAIFRSIGRNVDTFLTPEDEVNMLITGAIPETVRLGKKRGIPNREISVLLDIGSGNTKGGYRETRDKVTNFYSFNIREATKSFTQTVKAAMKTEGEKASFAQTAQTLSQTLIRKPLHDEAERKPGLLNRERVYLSGGVVWALVTLMRPEEINNNWVEVRPEHIRAFREKLATNPADLFSQKLDGRIANEDVRLKALKEIENVKNTFTVENLMAGTEILSVMSEDLNFKSRRVRFVRQGVWGWIMSYTKFQAAQ